MNGSIHVESGKRGFLLSYSAAFGELPFNISAELLDNALSIEIWNSPHMYIAFQLIRIGN
jgi:hypothetical protein